MSNLLHNAMKFTASGEIRFGCRLEGMEEAVSYTHLALKAEAKTNKDHSIAHWNKILAIDLANATAKRALDGIK